MIVNIVWELREDGSRYQLTVDLKNKTSRGNQVKKGSRVFWAKGEHVQIPCRVGDSNDAESLQAGPWS